MGLDMYLSRKIYLGLNYEHNREQYKDIVIKVKGVNINKVTYIEEEAITWRKANAIHKWFVDNVQDGKDDCGYYYVDKEQLEELYDLIKSIKNKKDAIAKLPTSEGFFFGSYEYDEWYFKELRRTEKELKKILDHKDDNGEYYYRSSW
jgi:hypothetical protein